METRQNDEIDLQQALIYSFRFLVRNLTTILVCIAAGMLATYLFVASRPAIYRGKMILLSNVVPEAYGNRVSESLENLVLEGNVSALSARLGISEPDARKITQIEIKIDKKDNEWAEDRLSGNEKKGLQSEDQILTVTVECKDKELPARLQDGILHYIQHNEVIAVRAQQRKEFLQSMIDKIGHELASLDSMKKRLLTNQPVYSRSSEMLLVYPTALYTEIIDLTKRQLIYKHELALATSVQVIEGIAVFKKPSNPTLPTWLTLGALGGFFFSLAVIGFRWLRKSTKS
jgi:uncharacterized protein involved in exopolysaccharide biosynthesis